MEPTGFTFQKRLPHPGLATYVDSYFMLQGPGNRPGETGHGNMVPLGYPILEFNLGDRWVKGPDGTEAEGPMDSNIMALTGVPFSIRPLGRIHTAAARLHPLALHKLMGSDLRKNMILDPYLVFGRQFTETLEKMALSASVDAVKDHLDQFFTNVFQNSRITTDYRVRHLIRNIIFSRGTLSISQTAKDMGLSQKRIEQLFHQHLGMAPKTYAGIARFQHAIACFRPGQKLTTLAHRAGFYDQSHFIRHFKALGGCPPKIFFEKKFTPTHVIANLYNFST